MEQVVDCISVHSVKTWDFPGLSCCVSLRNPGEERSDAVAKEGKNGSVEQRGERPAGEGVEDGTTIGMEGKS